MKKPYYQDEWVTIYHGDCREILPELPKVDLVLTSPPYDDLRLYGGQSFQFNGLPSLIYQVMVEGGCCVWVVGDQTINGSETGNSFREALGFMDAGFDLFDTMIYRKAPRGAVGNNKTYWQTFEYMFVFSKGTPKTINLIKDRENKEAREGDSGTKRLYDGTLLKSNRAGYSKCGRRTNVWEYFIGKGHSASDEIAYNHPAIFPETLASDHIISWSNQGDVVLDPFLGSGTTAYCAKKLNRKCIGIEIEERYCEIAAQRCSQGVFNLVEAIK